MLIAGLVLILFFGASLYYVWQVHKLSRLVETLGPEVVASVKPRDLYWAFATKFPGWLFQTLDKAEALDNSDIMRQAKKVRFMLKTYYGVLVAVLVLLFIVLIFKPSWIPKK